MGWLVEAAPAKINLALEVGGLRPDGYHDIHSVMQSLDLRDTIILEDRPAGVSLTCLTGDPLDQGALAYMGSDPGYMPPSDCRNIAWQAAELLMEATGIKRGLHIVLRKVIPVSAGLGGGSADAAAVLRGLNQAWNLGLTMEELVTIGARVGADVPFCLLGGTVEVKGIGEHVVPLPAAPSWPVILVNPPVGVSTAVCYSEYDRLLQPVSVDVDAMVAALAAEDLQQVATHLGNSLETVTFTQLPSLARVKATLAECGCIGVMMSGSGPTFFGLVNDVDHGDKVFAKLKAVLKQEPLDEMPNVYLTRFRSTPEVV